MSPKLLALALVLILTGPAGLRGQQKPQATPPPDAHEFPVVFLQNVTAGKTRVGTKVQAKLTLATLVNETVVPAGALFSGEVVESAAKTKTEPSRVSVRMDSLHWKKGSMPTKVYATAWYYPSIPQAGQDLKYGPDVPASATWNGEGAYPDPNSPAYKPFPGPDTGPKASVPDTPNSVTSKHPVLMKNVATERGSDGMLTLVSKRSNIKLDRITTYVLAGGDVPVAK